MDVVEDPCWKCSVYAGLWRRRVDWEDCWAMLLQDATCYVGRESCETSPNKLKATGWNDLSSMRCHNNQTPLHQFKAHQTTVKWNELVIALVENGPAWSTNYWDIFKLHNARSNDMCLTKGSRSVFIFD